MIHKMRLVNFAFNAIKEGKKDIEIRLNDEKRRQIKIGDKIEFTNLDTDETLLVNVINLYHFATFKELFDTFSHNRLGINDDDDERIMDTFYSKEEQEKYGALGIEISVNKNE